MAEDKPKKLTIEDMIKTLKGKGITEADPADIRSKLLGLNAGPASYAVSSALANLKSAWEGAENIDDMSAAMYEYSQALELSMGPVLQLSNSKYKDLIDSLPIEGAYGFMLGTSSSAINAYAGFKPQRRRR